MKTQRFLSMTRRGFLKKAGVSGLALGSLPVLAETLATRASADEETTGFIFAAVSKGPTIDGVAHTVVMDGAGWSPRRMPRAVVHLTLQQRRSGRVPEALLCPGNLAGQAAGEL
jgi:hypothetical protein